MPWQETSDPYLVWISEIMLQQTTVPVVKQRYPLWLKQFPDIAAVACADLTEVLRAFEGLGYYARARHLHQTARLVYQNGWPEDYSSLLKLPGLGDYTAKTIMSRCFQKPVLAFDVNINRLFSRLYMTYPLTEQDKKKLQESFEPLLKKHDPALMGQAVMRFAQLECKKNQPVCLTCIFAMICESRRCGVETTLFPQKQKKKIYSESIVLIWRRGNEILVEKRQKGIGQGMYCLPRLSSQAFQRCSEESRALPIPLKARVHSYTNHYEKLKPYFLQTEEDLSVFFDLKEHYCFENEKKLKKLPFMAVYRDILQDLEQEKFFLFNEESNHEHRTGEGIF